MTKKKLVAIISIVLLVLSFVVIVQATLEGERLSALAVVLLAHAVLADALMLDLVGFAEASPDEPQEDPAARVSREYGLSARESEVLVKYLEVRDIRACASELFIAPGTVKTHLSHIYAKAGVSGCGELLRLCEAR